MPEQSLIQLLSQRDVIRLIALETDRELEHGSASELELLSTQDRARPVDSDDQVLAGGAEEELSFARHRPTT